MEMEQVYDTEGNVDFDTYFLVEHMVPAPPIIVIPKGVPKAVKRELQLSFELFWLDHGACVNRLRVSLERLLDELKVPKKAKTTKGKFEDLTLHKRIEKAKLDDDGIKEFLMAVKWVGNIGTHDGEVDVDFLLNTYALYEAALEDIYDKKRSKLLRIAADINKKKGAVARKAPPVRRKR